MSQVRFATMAGGANKLSLFDAQRTYPATGCSEERRRIRSLCRKPMPGEERDPLWRPVEPEDIEDPIKGVDYGRTYPSDETALYYWRPNYFRRQGSAGESPT